MSTKPKASPSPVILPQETNLSFMHFSWLYTITLRQFRKGLLWGRERWQERKIGGRQTLKVEGHLKGEWWGEEVKSEMGWQGVGTLPGVLFHPYRAQPGLWPGPQRGQPKQTTGSGKVCFFPRPGGKGLGRLLAQLDWHGEVKSSGQARQVFSVCQLVQITHLQTWILGMKGGVLVLQSLFDTTAAHPKLSIFILLCLKKILFKCLFFPSNRII